MSTTLQPLMIFFSVLVVVAVMLVILIVLVALIKLGKAGQYLTHSRSPHVNQRSIQRTQANASVFTVYNNEPPPYEVVVNSNLPEYSPRDIPPLYKEKEDTQIWSLFFQVMKL